MHVISVSLGHIAKRMSMTVKRTPVLMVAPALMASTTTSVSARRDGKESTVTSIGTSVHQILVVTVASALTWWPTLSVNVLITGRARLAPSEILNVTETLVRMGAPAVTLGTLSPVTVQRNLKAALVSFPQ